MCGAARAAAGAAGRVLCCGPWESSPPLGLWGPWGHWRPEPTLTAEVGGVGEVGHAIGPGQLWSLGPVHPPYLPPSLMHGPSLRFLLPHYAQGPEDATEMDSVLDLSTPGGRMALITPTT